MRRNRSQKPSENPNRRYKKKIYSLCKRVSKGDKQAESELASELGKSSTAVWAVKHWLKLHRKKPAVLGSAANKIKARGLPTYGNAFKPYSGGLPGLGKR